MQATKIPGNPPEVRPVVGQRIIIETPLGYYFVGYGDRFGGCISFDHRPDPDRWTSGLVVAWWPDPRFDVPGEAQEADEYGKATEPEDLGSEDPKHNVPAEEWHVPVMVSIPAETADGFVAALREIASPRIPYVDDLEELRARAELARQEAIMDLEDRMRAAFGMDREVRE